MLRFGINLFGSSYLMIGLSSVFALVIIFTNVSRQKMIHYNSFIITSLLLSPLLIIGINLLLLKKWILKFIPIISLYSVFIFSLFNFFFILPILKRTYDPIGSILGNIAGWIIYILCFVGSIYYFRRPIVREQFK